MEPTIIHNQPQKPEHAYWERPKKEATILFMTANPKDTEVLNINREFTAVQETLESGDKPFELRLRLDVGRDELSRILYKDRPTIVHFSGHGLAQQGLVLQNEQDYSEVLSSEAMADLLRGFSDTIQCVVLNACYSDVQARALAQYIPFVIGTDNAIADVKAIEFAKTFYLGLSANEGYEKAFRNAVAQLGAQELSAGGQPVLYRWNTAAQPEIVEEESLAENATTWKDPRDGNVYPLLQLAGKTWMGRNFSYLPPNDPEARIYEDDALTYLEQYGVLYSWKAAKRLCPKGWRLPTLEEWKTLCKELGGYSLLVDYDADEWKDTGNKDRAYKALVAGGKSGFEAPLAGNCEENIFNYLEGVACYWTGTLYYHSDVWYVCLEEGAGPYIGVENMNVLQSVRYVKE